MSPPEEGPTTRPRCTAPEADAWLAQHGPGCWRSADAAALRDAAAAVPDAELAAWPDVARWRALADVLGEQGEALPCLELAHAGHLARGDLVEAALDAHLALALCLIDLGAMDAVASWVQRSLDAPEPPPGHAGLWWWHAGRAARAVLEPAHAPGLAVAWLHQALAPLATVLAPHEKLLVAQVLVNAHFARQQYEQFDLIAAAVMAPATFDAVPPLLQARWLHTLGFACYQVGRHDAAHDAWQRGLLLSTRCQLVQAGWMLTLALLRLALDRGQLDEAARLEAAVQPHWGSGRTIQLMVLQQMRGRLWLLRGQPAQAQALLSEALALGAQAGLGAAELASPRTDEAQVLVSLGQTPAALVLLDGLAQAASGRDRVVFQCLHGLLSAWVDHTQDQPAAQSALDQALRDAQAIRYTMFFRLLPVLAGQLCGLALRWNLHAAFVTEVVRARELPAPPDADAHWPWPVYLRLLGGFELRLRGSVQPRPAKAQARPLELLRLLACEADLSLAMRRAADALWPDADGASAHKSLEVTVQRLRRVLGDDTLLRVHEATLTLDASRVSCDLAQRRALGQHLQAQAMQAPAADDAQAHTALWQAADALQRWVAVGGGPHAELLPGAAEQAWLLARRVDVAADSQRTRNAVQSLLLRATERAAARGDTARGDEALLRALAQGLAAW